jgi:hypothetical protein
VAGNGPAFFAYANSQQTISGWVTLQLATELYDTNSCYNNSNYRFIPNVAGYYQINGNISYLSNNGTNTNFVVSIAKNGSEYIRGGGTPVVTAANNYYFTVGGLVYMNGSTDYIELQCYSNSSIVLQSGQPGAAMSGFLARSA